LGDRNLTIAKGTIFDCVLNTKLISTVSGMTTCTVSRNVYSDNGRVLLIERGSLVTGEYVSNLAPGKDRIFVLWDRVKTTEGVTIDINSPAADALGEAGVGGDINNHWFQRIGASVLLSFIDDFVDYETTKQASSSGVLVMNNTSQQSQSLAAKILDSTINIPPTLTRNQGDKVTVFVARDLDFSGVYELRPE
jgi:type IV secretion system protein VirB10